MAGKVNEANKPTKSKEVVQKPRQSATVEEKMTQRDEMFVKEYLIDLNPRRAALAAGFSESVAHVKSFGWVSNPNAKPLVYQAIRQAMAERSIRTQITADKVLERMWNIAIADPNELMQNRRINCRHCYGIDHKFQWCDEAEFEQALRAVMAEEEAMQVDMPGYKAVYPTDEGGYGFISVKPPHDDCPKCYGEGHVETIFLDTRNLSPQGQALYAGIKQTKDGMEIKTHDQQAALMNVARHLGMFNDKLTLKGDAENPLEVLLRSLPGNTLRPVDDKNE